MRLALSSAACVAAIGAASAEDATVQLHLKGAAVEFNGRLLGFDGREFRVEVPAFGTLRLDAARYACAGAACPKAAVAVAPAIVPAVSVKPASQSTMALDSAAAIERVTLSDRTGIGSELLPALIKGFAESGRRSVRQIVGADPTRVGYEIRDAGGRRSAVFEIVRGAGTAAAIDDLAPGAGDAMLLPRQLDPAERLVLRQSLAATRREYRELVLALDGLIVIMPIERQLARLQTNEALGIFSGGIRNWAELGKPAAPIAVFAGGNGDHLASSVLAPREMALRPDLTRIDNEMELSDHVANDANAVGITSLAFERNARAVELGEPCGIDSAPSEFAVKSEDYALSRRLYLHATVAAPGSTLAQFLAFAVSEKAQALVREARLVDQEIGRRPAVELIAAQARVEVQQLTPAEQAARARLHTRATGADRLSVTFRFALASFELDAKAQQDIVRLRSWMTAPERRGARILLAGFSDQLGPPDINLTLALRRAEQVRAALGPALAARLGVQVDGFGQLNPVACNETPEGRRVNRRVEVWQLPSPAASVTPVAARATKR